MALRASPKITGHQFPDDAYFSDTIIVAIISTLVLMPVGTILQQMMDLSNTVHAPFGWQETIPNVFVRILVGGSDGHRSWHWAFPPHHRKSLIALRRPMNPVFQWVLENGGNPSIVIIYDHVAKLLGWIKSLIFGEEPEVGPAEAQMHEHKEPEVRPELAVGPPRPPRRGKLQRCPRCGGSDGNRRPSPRDAGGGPGGPRGRP